MQDIPALLTDEEYEELDLLLLSSANEDDESILSLVELDAFFAAILSSPETILPSKWLHKIWNNQEPNFENTKLLERCIDLVLRYYNEVVHNLSLGEDGYYPLFDVVDADENETDGDQYVITGDWCIAYMYGLEFAGIHNVPNEIKSDFDLIKHYRDKELDLEDYEELTPKETVEKAYDIRQAILNIYQYMNNIHLSNLS